MRALAQEFHVSDNFKNKSWSELRLLPTPVARFGKPGSGVLDGALFTFALATDPEAFVFIEGPRDDRRPRMAIRLCPMGCFEMKGTHKGKAVWDVPYKKDAYDPSKTYFVRLD